MGEKIEQSISDEELVLHVFQILGKLELPHWMVIFLLCYGFEEQAIRISRSDGEQKFFLLCEQRRAKF